MTRKMMFRTGLVAAGTLTATVLAGSAAQAATGDDERRHSGMQRTHERMHEGNPGMKRMHELMKQGNPGMKRMHERMQEHGGMHGGMRM